MSNDGGGDGLTKFMLLILAVAIVAVAIASCRSLPVGNGVTWDSTAEVERNATEQLRISQENETERLRISESADTQRTWAIGLVSLGVIAVVVVGVVKMVQADAQRQPAPNVYLLPPPQVIEALTVLNPADGYRPEYEDGQWWFVSDKRQDCMTVDEARRLTG